jgi:hypothetical protein
VPHHALREDLAVVRMHRDDFIRQHAIARRAFRACDARKEERDERSDASNWHDICRGRGDSQLIFAH